MGSKGRGRICAANWQHVPSLCAASPRAAYRGPVAAVGNGNARHGAATRRIRAPYGQSGSGRFRNRVRWPLSAVKLLQSFDIGSMRMPPFLNTFTTRMLRGDLSIGARYHS